jgi:signal transduction histidine kinase
MKRILIVDDDAAVRQAYREILTPQENEFHLTGEGLFGSARNAPLNRPLSYKIREAENGLEATELVWEARLRGKPFGVAFVDMKMPGMNGAETAREIWKIEPNMKMVIVTAFSDILPDEIVRIVGRDDIFYLRKPFNPEEIRQFARALCNQWVFDREREEALLAEEGRKRESLVCMAGAVAHHLNNLLAVVMGNLELYKMNLQKKDGRYHYLEDAERGANRAADLGRHLLAYLGQRLIRKSDCDLSMEISSAVPLIKVPPPPDVRLETRLAPNLPTVSLDPEAFREILLGLITNAWEAMGRDEGTVTVATGVTRFDPSGWLKIIAPEEFDGEYVYLEVTDDGAGMDTDTLERMFDPFFSTKFTGRGLGLAMIQGIVQSHHGWIGVSDCSDKGTTLRVGFPAAQTSG